MTSAAVAVAVMAVWLYLLAARARLAEGSDFDRRPPAPAPESWPAVTVIVPARDESEMLRFTLPSWLSFYYPSAVETILVDDCSQDGTGEAAAQTARALGRDDLRVLETEEHTSELQSHSKSRMPSSA